MVLFHYYFIYRLSSYWRSGCEAWLIEREKTLDLSLLLPPHQSFDNTTTSGAIHRASHSTIRTGIFADTSGAIYGLRGHLGGEVDVGNNKKYVQELIVNVIIYFSASQDIVKGCDIK